MWREARDSEVEGGFLGRHGNVTKFYGEELLQAYKFSQGSAHSRWASRDHNLRDVVEVIETARDNLDTHKRHRELGIVDEEASSDSDSSDEDEGRSDVDGHNDEDRHRIADGSAEDKQGPMDQLRDYRKRDKALHRQHRGLMQWKVRSLGLN